MMPAYVALFKWMLACADSLLAGLLVWLVLSAASRMRPALLSRRAVWLAAQGVVVCAALLPFVPRGERMSIAPPVTLNAQDASAIRDVALVPEELATSHGAASEARETVAVRDAAPDMHVPPLTVLLPTFWMLLYAAGLAWTLARLLRARSLWRGLLSMARPLSPQDLCTHGAFNADQLTEIANRRLIVMETDVAISPMLIGVRSPILLLPAHLRGFSAEQQQMIVAHELHHWRQRDPLCLGLAAVVCTVFWFNPALRWMSGKLEWALELACDQHVLAGRPQQQRKQYAAALLQQWKAQMTVLPAGGVAFGGFNGATAAARIRQMQAALPALSRTTAGLIAVVMLAILAGGALLQPALAFNAAPHPATQPIQNAPAAVQQAWRYPLDKMRVTGFFGVYRDVMTTPHRGIDLAASKGTQVHAVADGVVISAGALAEHEGRYGNAIIIEHGARRSLYAHLSSVAVKAGDHVHAGQLIATVGATGFATGPHLHFEVRQNQQFIDPATMLANLDAHASKHALQVRRQQQGI